MNKKKIIKNTTNTPILVPYLAIEVAPLSQVIVDPSQYFLLASDLTTDITPDELSTLILDGDLVINDGVDDLLPEQAINYLKWPDRASNIRFEAAPERISGWESKNIQDAVEEGKVKISTTDIVGGTLIDKLVAGSNITIIKQNEGDNETLTVSSIGAEPVSLLREVTCINIGGVIVNNESNLLFEPDPLNDKISFYIEGDCDV